MATTDTSSPLYHAKRSLGADMVILLITAILMVFTPALVLAGGAVALTLLLPKIPPQIADLLLFDQSSPLRWLVPAVLVLTIALGVIAPLMVWVERRILGLMQSRLGPNRVGPFGLFQPLADTFKLISKEDIIPSQASKMLFKLAPCLVLFPALAAWVVIPMGPVLKLAGKESLIYQMSNFNIGILYIFAISSLGVLGIVLAGWSSGSKYPLLGSLRSTNQMLSYEVPLGISVMGVLMISGTLRPETIVTEQDAAGIWYIFPQLVGFMIFLIAGIAETNRVPFDLAEAEAELTAGFHTEYSGFRFAAFFMAEYLNMWVMCCLATLLFFGGWLLPFQGFILAHTSLGEPRLALLLAGLQALSFITKAFSFMFFFIWIRSTIPRYRYDQLMHLGWKVLIPISLVNLVCTAVAVSFDAVVWVPVAVILGIGCYAFLDRTVPAPVSVVR
jgi:NADH-quinone oxidoreductase subunit H